MFLFTSFWLFIFSWFALLCFGTYVIVKKARYHKADKAVKKSARNDQSTLIKNKVKLAEEAAKRGDSRALYQITNGIIGKKYNINGPVWDPSSVLVTKPSAVNELWVFHFKRLLNRPQPISDPLNISVEPPSTDRESSSCQEIWGMVDGKEKTV